MEIIWLLVKTQQFIEYAPLFDKMSWRGYSDRIYKRVFSLITACSKHCKRYKNVFYYFESQNGAQI